jgi:hypothetical protein
VGLSEAAEWARHFANLETEMDKLLAQMFGVTQAEMNKWIHPGRYVTGAELSAAGLAELVELKPIRLYERNGAPKSPRRVRAGR